MHIVYTAYNLGDVLSVNIPWCCVNVCSFHYIIVNWFCVHLYSQLVLCTLVQSTGFVYTCTMNWLYIHLYWKLVLCTLIQLTGFVYTYTVNWFCVHLHRNWFCGTCTETDFAQSWYTDCTKFACWLHKVCTNFAIH